jgi:hypothetical protein
VVRRWPVLPLLHGIEGSLHEERVAAYQSQPFNYPVLVNESG